MRKTIAGMFCVASVAFSQGITVPDGTRLRVRLDQAISSASAEEGQTIEMSVTENIKVNGTVVIPEGARVTGTVTQAQEKRRMGRAGKLDFSVDRVRAADGEWVPLRYTLTKKSGESHATRNGIITAGVAVAFWPAAPFVLLAKGKDITINKGVTLDVFTDADHVIKQSTPAGTQIAASGVAPAAAEAGSASVTITSASPGAEIEVNGAFLGSTPSTLRLPAGSHTITVRSGDRVWQRVVQVMAGSSVTLTASFPAAASTRARLN